MSEVKVQGAAGTIQKALLQELHKIQLKNPGFSLRAFARKLGVQPSALSEILKGKRGVSRKLAQRLADRLLLPPDEREALLAPLPLRRSQSSKLLQTQKITQLTMDHFQMISDWYHFAILSLAETAGFQSDAQWISSRLGITKSTTQSALERLLRLGMVEKDKNENLSVSGVSYAAPDEISSLSLRKAHANNLELAKVSLEQDAIDLRDFTATTMAIDPAKLPEAKRRIRQFQKELNAFLETDEKKEVYKICIQLFPLSMNGENKNA